LRHVSQAPQGKPDPAQGAARPVRLEEHQRPGHRHPREDADLEEEMIHEMECEVEHHHRAARAPNKKERRADDVQADRPIGRKIPLEFVARRAGDVASSYADPSAARAELGWKTELGLDSMCRDLWRWQSQNPAGYP
jgi:hypothetical protein